MDFRFGELGMFFWPKEEFFRERIYRLVLDQFYLGVSFFVVQENKFTLLVNEISFFFFFLVDLCFE